MVQSCVNECGSFKLPCSSGIAFVKWFEVHYVQGCFDCIPYTLLFVSDTWDVYEEVSNVTFKHSSSDSDFMLNCSNPCADFSRAQSTFV